MGVFHQPDKTKCHCCDALNFGEPAPDCSDCGGTGKPRPKKAERKMADCCDEGRRLIIELDNDQKAFPGFKHMRLQVSTPSGSLHGNMPIFYCPWCGTKFEDPNPGV